VLRFGLTFSQKIQSGIHEQPVKRCKMKKEIYSTSSLVEVDIIKSFLESRGIKCLIWDKNIATSLPAVIYSSGIRLAVDEKDYNLAKEIIQEYLQKKEEHI
jgi:hypothetical protein